MAIAVFSKDKRLDVMVGDSTPVKIRASQPVELNCDTRMTVAIDGPWDESFVNGWKSLPVELKLEIMSLVVKDELGCRIYHHHCMSKALCSTLRTTPEISLLATELYYSRNVFVINVMGSDYNLLTKYPPITFAHFIKRLEINVFARQNEGPAFELLSRITSRKYRLTNVRNIKLLVHLQWRNTLAYSDIAKEVARVNTMLGEKVQFSCAGNLLVEPLLSLDGPIPTRIVKLVEDKVEFGVGQMER
ncbi:hypothetical protein BDV96DRAFT_647266 [Lophiotrema nucula]|uniref:F-box domain-containing protein n=1 Tax=Lophiotrema nucula TaxID=690887 RepID=A0A6A5Z553_9PLEO|nr:hypothetical protein BDV96DRAFT_647266 [Lophiotrema nucula]